MFGRGTTIDRELVNNGITVRAEAVAEAIPALAVGVPVLDSNDAEVYPGAVAIGYRLADWNGSRSDPRQVDGVKTSIGQAVTEGGSATPV